MTKSQKQLLALLSFAMWGTNINENIAPSEWPEVFEQSKAQAVLPMTLFGATNFQKQIPSDLYAKWRNAVLSSAMRNEKLMRAQDKLLSLMANTGIPCIILKGSSLSVNYPKSEMRPLGDIDMLIRPEDVEKARSLLRENGFNDPETNHPFHIDFYGNGIVLELHYAVSTFPDTITGKKTEKIMAQCFESSQLHLLNDYKFPGLSNVHQAINLLLHMERHIVEGGIGLRQLCDWALFVASIPEIEFSKQIIPILESCGLFRFAQALTKTCIDYLNLNPQIAKWAANVSCSTCNTLINEILRTGNFGRGTASDDMSFIFVEQNKQRNLFFTAVSRLNKLARQHFPITHKYPFLLPVFWVYIPMRYWVRSILNLRPKKSIVKSLSTAKTRNQLYRDLKIFEEDAD